MDAPTAMHAACKPPVTQRIDSCVYVTVQSGQAANEDWLSSSEEAHDPRTITCEIIHCLGHTATMTFRELTLFPCSDDEFSLR